ncbi:hypothetical protein IZU89_15470 [Cellulophaga lytica]|uniref:hypothetical protein n=1 Tax=Cellulophaga lytica TaxID=979 RepID=UPI0032E4500F
MRTLSIILFALATAVTTTITTASFTGTYDGFEDEMYVFTTDEGQTMEFDEVSPETLEKYDLLDESFKGKTFKVTYEVVTYTNDETEEEEVKNILTDLTLLEE